MKGKLIKIENFWILLAIGIIIHNYWYGIDKEYYIIQLLFTLMFIIMCIGGYIFNKTLEDKYKNLKK